MNMFLLKPPKGMAARQTAKTTKTNDFLARSFHGLEYDTGDTEYSHIPPILQECTRRYDIIFVKGSSKALYLGLRVTTPVVDIEEWGCPPLTMVAATAVTCPISHNGRHHCALRNAVGIRDWIAMHGGLLMPLPHEEETEQTDRQDQAAAVTEQAQTNDRTQTHDHTHRARSCPHRRRTGRGRRPAQQ